MDKMNGNENQKIEPSCLMDGCCSSNSNSRRNFIKNLAFGAGALSLPMIPVLPGCFSVDKNGHLIPADKRLSTEWVKSLTERGQPEVYSSKRDELKYIGMPIGGICAGQLYISGDGRLWLWDIFQSNYKREGPAEPKKWRLDQFSMGGLYQNPHVSSKENDRFHVKNGFAIRYRNNNQIETFSLDNKGFDDISFRGEYPIAKITYKKEGLPLAVNLKAYSPFIPLNVKDSGIPATVMSYEFTNNGKLDISLDIGGWLENKVCPEINDVEFERNNTILRSENRTTVFMTAAGDGLSVRKGYGDMAISLLGDTTAHHASAKLKSDDYESDIFGEHGDAAAAFKVKQSAVGGLSTSINLKSGESKTVTFLVSWFFPYYNEHPNDGSQMGAINDLAKLKRHYANYYSNANDFASYVANNFDRLSNTTLAWNKTWYDSTLPFWFLDRSFISLDCLASQTSHLFDNGRFWGWEGVDCCPGTCTHVWQYAQGMAHIFPSLERDLRERVDYGISYDQGLIHYRGENGKNFVVDGQLGTIIRVYREHKIASDETFLSHIWPKVKQSMQYVIDQSTEGLLEGEQPHTLDAAWFGPMGWISGMYLAALKASEQMAIEMNDKDFAKTCSAMLGKGRKNYVDKLFNGEYFVHLNPDFNSINTNTGCHIDQVLGQSFAYQINLPNVLPQKETRLALKSIWKYNFAIDAGQYAKDHKTIKGERIYAMPEEAGLLMTTWPYGGDEKAVPGMAARPDHSDYWEGPGGYFDECMNGFEYQAASHMVWENMLTEGLSVMKAVHERYNAAKRNPYDEVECSSHYSRSMASYGIFIAACGFEYHGPKGIIGFSPKISPENFKAPFTTAEGWGSFSQKVVDGKQTEQIDLRYGKLKLKKWSFHPINGMQANRVEVKVDGKTIDARFNYEDASYIVHVENEISMNAGQGLEISFI
ncbi:GH116 family glycosyl hydrolase [Draconibacterium sp.]|nr:GH116 family glycosyl hydrolase [Draconibacterium sp.]